MNILNIEHISKIYGEKVIFDDVSLGIQEGDKAGIIGINGTGKSTLLKIAAGIEEPDQGDCIRAGSAVIRYLPQNPEFDEKMTVLECVLKGYDSRRTGMDWDLEGEGKNMLMTLGIGDFEAKTGELSGGQKKRVALAAVLLHPCDILILDEPTNHLDHAMASWLENYLKRWRGTLLMVTHDRYFLDSVSNRILEIDKGKLYSYDTNYEGFLELKAQREDMAQASERKRRSILRTELEWVKRGARARSTKQKARLERYEELKNQEGPASDGRVEMSSVYTRMGKTTVELSHICKRMGERTLIQDFSYIFLKNDRVGFVGTNGCGKTTLMKIIAGRLEPDMGQVNIGQTIKIGYYSQEIENSKEAGIAYMDPKMRVIDYIRETAEYVRTEEGLVSASAMLERFLFPSSLQYSPLGKLSGGERRRLNLLRVLMEAPNVLILDEPTNDLDIATLTILEDYLDRFQGIVIVVSHDRYFLDRTVKRIFAFEEGGVLKQYEGGYTDYARKAAEHTGIRKHTGDTARLADTTAGSADKVIKGSAGTGEKNSRNTWKVRDTKKLKFTYREQQEYETIEEDIMELEEELSDLDDQMMENATNSVKLSELSGKKEEIQKLLDEKMQRWEYLEELAEKIKEQNSAQ